LVRRAEIGGEPYQRGFHIVKQTQVRATRRAAAGNEHIVAPRPRQAREGRAGGLSHPALGAVADDGAANPARGGEPDADSACSVPPIAGLHQHSSSRAGETLRGRQKIGALAESFKGLGGFGQAETFLEAA
jgi:hypothetical protein